MMVDSFLPTMRKLVAQRLKREGYSQGKIASMLGITQASVSNYLSRPSEEIGLDALGVTAEEAGRYAALLAEDLKKNPVYAVYTLYSIWSAILGAGKACEGHRGQKPYLATCEVCLSTFGERQARSDVAIQHVQDAIKQIEGSSIFVRVMPEVSVNLAYAGDEAVSPEGVVAIPGRIVRVRGESRSFMRPEFGASTHLATILLEVRRRLPEFHAAMNLRYDATMDAVLRRSRALQLRLGRYPEEGANDKVVEAVRRALVRSERFDCIVDEGGPGVEPSLYLFEKDANAVVKRAIAIARGYSSSSSSSSSSSPAT